jgi:three-Cys-motif partner protein
VPAEDGCYLPEINRHSLEKIRRHNYYAAIFCKAMRRRWPQLAYVGLYSGPGKARLAGTGQVVETSALSVLRQEVPFTKYIFVDADERCIDALRIRANELGRDLDVTYICANVNDSVDAVCAAMPRFSKEHGLLSLCFVDPFRVDLDFDVIRELGSRYMMDFLVMLPLGYDVRRNITRYLGDQDADRLARLIDNPRWREAWRTSGKSQREFVRFVLEQFDAAMQRLGYLERELEDTVHVKVTGMGVFLYALALYSKHPLGTTFWKTTVRAADPQYGLGL